MAPSGGSQLRQQGVFATVGLVLVQPFRGVGELCTRLLEDWLISFGAFRAAVLGGALLGYVRSGE